MQQNEIADLAWIRLRQTESRVVDNHLKPFVTSKLPREVMLSALDDFFPEEGLADQIDKDLLFNNFFIPWFLFNWIPGDTFGMNQFDDELTIALNYRKKHAIRLNSLEKRFIEEISQTYYSYYTVLEVEFEKSIVLKDALLGTLHTIKERKGTHYLKRGDIVFSRLLTMNDQSIAVGMAPYPIPATYQTDLVHFKKWLINENNNQPLTPSVLRNEFDIDLFDYFFETLNECFNRPMPTLTNTDGDLIQFMKSYFKLNIPVEEALKKLWRLSLAKNVNQFLEYIKSEYPDGQQIEFPWLKKGNKKHKSLENTVMGHITIHENRLILETNSEKRSEQGKKLLIKYLGEESIHFQQTLIESQEQKLKSLPEGNNSKDPSDLMKSPEMEEQLKQMAVEHWQSWFDQPIPALGDITPREAAKTEDGRELLEALLLQYERFDQERDDDSCHLIADINYLKTELELS